VHDLIDVSVCAVPMREFIVQRAQEQGMHVSGFAELCQSLDYLIFDDVQVAFSPFPGCLSALDSNAVAFVLSCAGVCFTVLILVLCRDATRAKQTSLSSTAC
jgi:hypothetical protein